jgi:hypothetical protein
VLSHALSYCDYNGLLRWTAKQGGLLKEFSFFILMTPNEKNMLRFRDMAWVMLDSLP